MNNLTQIWCSLGVAFYSEPTKIPSCPEDGIIAFLKSGEFPKDKKMMAIILGWLQEYSKLVHIERLKNLIKELTDYEAALLGAMAKKCVTNKDHRWNAIVKSIKARIGEKTFQTGDSDTFLAIKGQDLDFLEFGIKIAPIKIDMIGKKLRTRKYLINNNTWIKNRILFGTNIRADIATIRELGLAQTAYRASQIAVCSMNAAYNNWDDLEQVEWFISKKSPA